MDTEQTKLQSFFDRDKVFPWPWNLADEVITGDIADVADGEKISLMLEEYDHGHITVHCRIEEMDALAKHLFEKLIRDRSFFDATVENVHAKVDAFLERWKEKASADPQSATSAALVDLAEAYVAELKEVRKWGWIPALIDGSSEPFLTNACLAALASDLPGKNQEEISGIFSLLSSPATFGEVQKSEIEKWRLVMEIGDEGVRKFLSVAESDEALSSLEPSVRGPLLAYVERFSWLLYNYEGPLLDVSRLKASLNGLTVEQAHKELDTITTRHDETMSGQESFYAENSLSDRTRYLIEIAQAFMILKEYRKSVYQQSYAQADKILARIAEQAGMELDELKFLSLAEMRAAIDDPAPYATIARQRRNGYLVVMVEGGTSRYLDGDEAHAQAEALKERREKIEVKELRGQVAYPGVVRGIAKIICTADDLPKMEEGNILISSSTNPDLLPAMKLAAAVVTEMGGIICHAAIVARELHIPCVVGTKIALKVIKDGDVVEVDATNGVVHIL
jgi:phosphohistidine swiveling domain-containing protein